MKILISIISIMMSTTIIFASPGMENYSPERQKEVQRIRTEAKNQQKKLLLKIDKMITRLENKEDSNKIDDKKIAKLEKAIDKSFNKQVKRSEKLLRDKNDFILAFNHQKALNPELTQYEFKQLLLGSIDKKRMERSKSNFIHDLKKSSTMASTLKNIKRIVEGNDVRAIVKLLKKSKGRNIAKRQYHYGPGIDEKIDILHTIAVFSAFISLCGLMVLIVGAAAVGGVISGFLWPLGFFIIPGLIYIILTVRINSIEEKFYSRNY